MQDVITTVIIDEVHNRSAQSDYVLALTLSCNAEGHTPEISADERNRGPQSCGRAYSTVSATSNEGRHASCEEVLSRTAPGQSS